MTKFSAGFLNRSSWNALLLVILQGVVLGPGQGLAQQTVQASESLGLVACSATAAPASVQAQGIAELVGDIILICDNVPAALGFADPARNAAAVDLHVSLNVAAANNVDFGLGAQVSDAVLIINENVCGAPSASGSTFGGCGAPDPRIQDPQYGILAGGNRVEWRNVTFPIPGTSVSGQAVSDCNVDPMACYPFETIVRITALRANASQLDQGQDSIVASVTMNASAPILLNNDVLTVGYTSTEPPDGPPPVVPGVVCTAASQPRPVDPAGAQEPMGDLVLTCENTLSAPSGSVAVLDLELSLNVDVTNDSDSGPPVLVVNQNDCETPAATGSVFGSCGAPDPSIQDPQIGAQGSARTLVWQDLSFPIPEGAGDVTTLHIKGIRANAGQLSSLGQAQVTGLITIGLAVTNRNVSLAVPLATPTPVDPAPPDGDPGLNTCTTVSTPRVVRAEGVTELIGDIVLVCEHLGPPPTASYVEMDLFLTLNTNVTNNIGSWLSPDLSDAVLVVNENNCQLPSGACGAPDRTIQSPRFGVLATPNRLEWRGVKVPVPTGPRPNSLEFPFPAQTTIRITSVRANASAFGIPEAAASPSAQIVASLAISAEGFTATDNVVSAASPVLGLVSEIPTVEKIEACRTGVAQSVVRLSEGFSNAFQVLGIPSFLQGSNGYEAGYWAPTSNLGGGALQGTRIALTFSGIPAGVTLSAPKLIETGDAAVSGDGLRLQWVSGTDVNGGGGTISEETDDLVFTSSGSGSAVVVYVVYEVMDSDPFRVEQLDIPVNASWSATSVASGAIQVKASLAPIGNVTQASLDAPEPRFLDHGAPGWLLQVIPCTTTLLFPHVSSQAGDDTRIVIANTSGLAGTTPAAGTCALQYHGSVVGGGPAPAEDVSASIPASATLDMTLAMGSQQDVGPAPDFAGYLVAVCDFEGAYGRAAIIDANDQILEFDAEVVDMSSGSRPALQEPLIVPFVSSRGGRHTELVIANTTDDGLGTSPASGSCTLDFEGENEPSRYGTLPILSGESLTLDLDVIAPDFEGYVVLDCGFPLTRSVARMTQGGAADTPSFSVPVEAVPYEETGGMGTALLVPNASTRGSDETWLALSNSTASSIASPTNMTCSLHYGGDADSPVLPPQVISLVAGEQVHFPLSVGLPSKGISPADDFLGSLSIACSSAASAYYYYTTGPDLTKLAAYGKAAEPVSLPLSTALEPVVYPLAEYDEELDRILVLANTSSDAFGSAPVDGFCLLRYRSGQGHSLDRLVPVAAGETLRYVFDQGLESEGIPWVFFEDSFVLAECDFPLARGVGYSHPGLEVPPTGSPKVMGMGPRSGSINRNTFEFQFGEYLGWEDLGVVNVLINDFLDGRNACYLAYSVPLNELYLVPDGGGGLLGGIAPGAVGDISNSQCTIHTATSSVRGFGRMLTLELDISFNPGAFSGDHVVYLAAGDQIGFNSGWRPSGVWRTSPASPAAPTVVSLTPGAVDGKQMNLGVTYRAPSNASEFSAVQLLVNSYLDGRNACYLGYDPAFNNLFLLADSGPPLLMPAVQPGVAGTVENSQCRIDAGASSVSQNGTDLTLNVAVTFKDYDGPAIVYAAGQTNSGGNSGWQAVGSIQVR